MARSAFDLKMRVTKMFFDRATVINAVGKAKVKALSKIGAFIRQRARTSMRKRRKVSQPGKPPSVHAGQLKDLLFFSYDPGAESVVVGPIAFKDGTAPKLLEFGGTVARRTRRGGPMKVMRYEARPFMGPALSESVSNPKLIDAWKNAVSK